MVRFNRSMNDVFNVEESSELLSVSSNRHAAPVRSWLPTLNCGSTKFGARG